MTPAEAILSLNARLGEVGSTVVLKRGDPTSPTASVTVKGFEGAITPKPLVGDVKQGDSMIILSPTGLGAFGVPKKGDWAHFLGRDRSIYFVRPLPIADIVVRYELLVRG